MDVRGFRAKIARFALGFAIVGVSTLAAPTFAAQDQGTGRLPHPDRIRSDDWHLTGRAALSGRPETILASFCQGGKTPGASCSSDADCAGGCAGGKVPGEPCTENGGLNCRGACTGMPDRRCSNFDDCAIFVGGKCTNPLPGTCTNPAPGTCLCNDGNPCTDDVNDPDQGCVFTPNALGCDDGTSCTQGDVCQGGTCTGTPVNCNDNDPCTVEYCDPVTACHSEPAPLHDVPGVHFTSRTTLSWPYEFPVTSYNTYRGTIPAGTLGSRLPAPPLYDHVCYERDDEHGDGLTTTIDTSLPGSATAFYYFVSIEQPDCGEGPLGSTSSGTPVPNPSPCTP